MPAKYFGSLMINDTLWHNVVTGVSGKDATVSFYISNHNSFDVNVSLAITTDTSALPVVSAHRIVHLDSLIYAKNSRIFPGMVLPGNIAYAIKSSDPNISVTVVGFED